jgi:hypothetical protein
MALLKSRARVCLPFARRRATDKRNPAMSGPGIATRTRLETRSIYIPSSRSTPVVKHVIATILGTPERVGNISWTRIRRLRSRRATQKPDRGRQPWPWRPRSHYRPHLQPTDWQSPPTRLRERNYCARRKKKLLKWWIGTMTWCVELSQSCQAACSCAESHGPLCIRSGSSSIWSGSSR